MRRRARAAGAESDRAERVRSAPRCGFVFYIDPKIAVGTIIETASGGLVLVQPRDRARLRQVGLSRRLRRPRRDADRRRRCARRARNAASTSASTRSSIIYSYPGRAPVIVVYAGDGDRRRAVQRRGVSGNDGVRPRIDPVGRPRAFAVPREGLRDYSERPSPPCATMTRLRLNLYRRCPHNARCSHAPIRHEEHHPAGNLHSSRRLSRFS